MKKKLLAILSLALIACMLLPFAAQAASYKAKADQAGVKVYKEAKTSSKVVYTLKKNEAVTVKEISGQWAKVSCNNGKVTGYCYDKYLTYSDKMLIYTNRKTKIYKSASSSSTVLANVSVDYPLYKVGVSGSYTMVKDYHGTFSGYVRTSYTALKQSKPFENAGTRVTYKNGSTTTTMPSAVRTSKCYYADTLSASMHRDYAVYLAQSKLGCKYSTTPNSTDRFSNYSFVKTCFANLGYSVGSTTTTIAHKGNAEYISRKNLLKGDIVCFDCDSSNGSLVDHIGIYVGSGYFVHASPSAGCVVVSKMSSGYYYKAFCWGRRIITK